MSKFNPLPFGVGERLIFVFFYVDMAQLHSREKFKMVTKPDDYLKLWWDYMGTEERKIVRTHIGNLYSLIEMDAWPEIIHVLTTFWDDQNMVFCFGDVELTPNIEDVLI